MIIPIIGVQFYKHNYIQVDDKINLQKESDKVSSPIMIAAYNSMNEKLGYVSGKSIKQKRIMEMINAQQTECRVFGIFKNQILVTLS